MQRDGTVMVGLSGGVDSAVAAALLRRTWARVIGVFIQPWSPTFLPCTWREERRDAMRVAAHLGIPFLTLDLSRSYEEDVARAMIDGYRAGDVPNPDMLCNREIKFGAFLRAAREYGATAIATGHYARVQECGGQVHLYCGSDVAKDQSFFLAALSQEQLRHVAMPLGAMKKSEVRALAAEFKLPNAKKKDSQGVCFLGEIELRSFMRHYIPLSEGAVVLPDGTRIGTHSGAALYAIGQRHGFRVDHARTGHAQFYVVQKHMDQNTIVVEEGSSESSGRRILITSLELSGLSWIGTRATVADYSSMSLIPRYHASPVPISSMEIRDEGRARVVLRHPIPPISSGQHVAFLFGDEILGSGVVRSPL